MWQRRDNLAGYGFLALPFIGFCLVVLVPTILVVWYSFNRFDLLTGEMTFLAGENYQRLFQDETFLRVMRNTAVFTVGVVPLQMVGGLALAVLINRRYPAIAFIRSVLFLPTLITLTAWSIVWEFLLQADGGVNGLLSIFGISGANWLQDDGWAMFWLVIVQALKNLGVTMVLFLAGLQGVPSELYEAAQVDGASPWRVFRRVTLPLIAPFSFLILIHATVSSLKTFELIQLMTGGGPGDATSVLVYYVYFVGFRLFEQGYASAIAIILFIITLLITIAQFWLRKRWVYGEV